MDPEELLNRANEGDMVAQYELAEHYGELLKHTEDETEIYQYSLDAMLWLKKSAQQGYEPAMEALTATFGPKKEHLLPINRQAMERGAAAVRG